MHHTQDAVGFATHNCSQGAALDGDTLKELLDGIGCHTQAGCVSIVGRTGGYDGFDEAQTPRGKSGVNVIFSEEDDSIIFQLDATA